MDEAIKPDLKAVEQAILEMFLCKKSGNGVFPSSEQKLIHLTRINHLAHDVGGFIVYVPGLLYLTLSDETSYEYTMDGEVLKKELWKAR